MLIKLQLRGTRAGRGAKAGGVGGMGEWTLERGDDDGDAAALATIFFQDSGDQAMRNQVSCIVPGYECRSLLPSAAACHSLPTSASNHLGQPPTSYASFPPPVPTW